MGCPHCTQEVTLYDQLKRLDCHNRLLRDATPHLDVLFAFPLAVEKPRLRCEGPVSCFEPIRDQLPGSNTAAYAVQHWVAVGDGRAGIAWCSLEASVVSLSELWPRPLSQTHRAATAPGQGQDFLRDPVQLAGGHVYSYAMVSNFRTNFAPIQPGDALFRYALTSYDGDWRRARELGWAAATPLVPVCLCGP